MCRGGGYWQDALAVRRGREKERGRGGGGRRGGEGRGGKGGADIIDPVMVLSRCGMCITAHGTQ